MSKDQNRLRRPNAIGRSFSTFWSNFWCCDLFDFRRSHHPKKTFDVLTLRCSDFWCSDPLSFFLCRSKSLLCRCIWTELKKVDCTFYQIQNDCYKNIDTKQLWGTWGLTFWHLADWCYFPIRYHPFPYLYVLWEGMKSCSKIFRIFSF